MSETDHEEVMKVLSDTPETRCEKLTGERQVVRAFKETITCTVRKN